jgi:DNA-directed RNA polymerase specialized sigma24 family protein
MATHWIKGVPPQVSGLESLTEEEWTEILQKLRLYTRKRYGFLHYKLGLDLDDVVYQAIADTLQGKRRWPPVDRVSGDTRKDVSLFVFLCNVVSSIVSHRMEEERRKVSIERITPSDFREDSDVASLEAVANVSIGEYLRCEAIYNRLVYVQLTKRMRELVSDDEELTEIVGLWSEDPGLKPSEIAEQLGLDIGKMRSAQKRLRRRLKNLREGAN